MVSKTVWAVGGILSCGLSQIASTLGFTVLGGKSIYDVVKKAFYQLKLNHAKSDEFIEKYQEKVTKYDQRVHDNKSIAKTLGLLLIPFVGMPLAGKYSARGTELCGESLGKKIPLGKKIVYPLSGKDKESFATKRGHASFQSMRDQTLAKLNGEQISINTEDGRTIDAVWASAAEETDKTVILFHGNFITLDGMAETAQYFQNEGLNVLLITMGGYPNSSEEIPTTEISSYHDAQAAVDYVFERKECAAQDIIAYGLSIGGTLAFHAGANNPGMHVISDQTLTTLNELPENILPLGGLDHFGKGLMQGSFPEGIDDGTYISDGLDNLSKARELQGSYFGIYSMFDDLMKARDGHSLTEDLAGAYLEKQKEDHEELDLKVKDITMKIPGGHGAQFINVSSFRNRIHKHLVNIGFIQEEEEESSESSGEVEEPQTTDTT